MTYLGVNHFRDGKRKTKRNWRDLSEVTWYANGQIQNKNPDVRFLNQHSKKIWNPIRHKSNSTSKKGILFNAH